MSVQNWIIQNIYSNATIQITVNTDTSEKIEIKKGVPQGDSLSPILFTLFINDFETTLRQKELFGIPLNSTTDILTLLYADDIIILANSQVDVQNKLNALEEYTRNKNLKINTDKTKIMLFTEEDPQIKRGHIAAKEII